MKKSFHQFFNFFATCIFQEWSDWELCASYLVWKEDPGGEVLDPDPGLDHHLLVGESGVARGRQLGVALPLPLRPELGYF